MKKKEYASKDLEKIIALGRQKGFLTYDEVNDMLPEDMSSSEEIDKFLPLLGPVCAKARVTKNGSLAEVALSRTYISIAALLTAYGLIGLMGKLSRIPPSCRGTTPYTSEVEHAIILHSG